MNRKTAEMIKKWRFELGYTWRRISEAYNERFCVGKYPNQIHGKDLCDQAMDILKETWKDGW